MGMPRTKPWIDAFVEVVSYCKSFGLKMYVMNFEGPTYGSLNFLFVNVTVGLSISANAWEQSISFPSAVRMLHTNRLSSPVGWTKFEASRRKANAGRSLSLAMSMEDCHWGLLYCGIALP